jgi:hypothetical protein
MKDYDFVFDKVRRDRMISRVDEILRCRGAELQLRSRQDVLFLAIDLFWKSSLCDAPATSLPVRLAPSLATLRDSTATKSSTAA